MDSETKPTTKTIVTAFGGATKLAALLNCSVTVISNWHRIGFPRARETDLVDLAMRVGVAGINSQVLRAASAAAIEASAQMTKPGKPGRPASASAPLPTHKADVVQT